MKTNILVQYQGGGYDGCFWEWNFFYIDKQNEFHNIHSSGRNGIDNLPDAERLIIDDESTTYIYDMNNEDDIKIFSKESHPVHVFGVLQWFNDYNAYKAELFIDFFAVCSVCQSQISDQDDLVIEGNVLLCYECFSIGECLCCESYVSEDDIVEVNPEEHYGHDYVCTYCKECHDEEREDADLEDLRWQAFCTGTPDIFSDKLRKLWICT